MLCLHEGMYTMCQWKSEEYVDSPGTKVTGGVSHNVCAGN